jgi:hypothetical protein
MRSMFLLVTALFLGSFVVGAVPGEAGAGPLPALQAGTAAAQLVEKVDYNRRYWRRYCRVNGCDPDDMIGAPTVVAPQIADEVIVAPDAVVVVPLRPTSCGQYHYWNGTACVDARYNTPYLGRRY